jgi:hypothetical protein
MAKANATAIFSVSQNFPAGTSITPEYTGKQGDNGIQGIVSAGPMPDPLTTVACQIQVDPTGVGGANGAGWQNVGGINGTGGMFASVKGGPADTPITINAETNSPFLPGWKARGVVIVANPPAGGLPISFTGNV